MPKHDQIRTIDTIFGTYRFIGDTYGYSILSPAFERPDKELLINMIKRSLAEGRRVLYLDIGAFVGDYTVGVQKYVNDKRLTTLSFEPDIDYYNLMLENIKNNRTLNVSAYNVGLSDRNAMIKTSRFPVLDHIAQSKRLTFRLKKLDSILSDSYYKKFDEIFIKIDIEGYEKETFEGAKKLFRSGKKVHLLVEDCINPSIIDYLLKHKFRFITKITPYDSFWEIH